MHFTHSIVDDSNMSELMENLRQTLKTYGLSNDGQHSKSYVTDKNKTLQSETVPQDMWPLYTRLAEQAQHSVLGDVVHGCSKEELWDRVDQLCHFMAACLPHQSLAVATWTVARNKNDKVRDFSKNTGITELCNT